MDLGKPLTTGSSPGQGSAPATNAMPPVVSSVQYTDNPKSSLPEGSTVRGNPTAGATPRAAPTDKAPVTHTHGLSDDHPSTDPASSATPTATIDPNKPSSQSAPTALPTNPNTHPGEQAEAVANEHPAVVGREVEKTKAAEREVKGERPEGTVVRGLEDDRLWAMLRAFDRDVTHVLHPATHLPPAEPDLRPSTLPNLPSHSETIKRNLERVFAAIGPSSVRGVREMQRLMDWGPQERKRTAMYCVAYFTCWIFGYTVAGVLSFFVAIVCFPDCRRYFFPPVSNTPSSLLATV